jgi:hypothetical protein
MLDLAAAGAFQIALEQWLELDDQRVTLAACESLTQYVGTDAVALADWNWHLT